MSETIKNNFSSEPNIQSELSAWDSLESISFAGESINSPELQKISSPEKQSESKESDIPVSHEYQKLYDDLVDGKNIYGEWTENDEYIPPTSEQIRSLNMESDSPYLATGQNGYFVDQIEKNGFGKLKISESDREDARFISECFGVKTGYGVHKETILYTTLPGTVEMNYASQTFPAGIYEDVFQCSPDHGLPYPPKLGESEESYWMRVLSSKIEESEIFPNDKKEEALSRGQNLIKHFCAHENRIYLIPVKNVLENKCTFGDIFGYRNGKLSEEKVKEIISKQPTLSERIEDSRRGEIDDIHTMYQDPNFDSEFGVALYGDIRKDDIKCVKIEHRYQTIQKKAKESGLKPGDEIPPDFYE